MKLWWVSSTWLRLSWPCAHSSWVHLNCLLPWQVIAKFLALMYSYLNISMSKNVISDEIKGREIHHSFPITLFQVRNGMHCIFICQVGLCGSHWDQLDSIFLSIGPFRTSHHCFLLDFFVRFFIYLDFYLWWNLQPRTARLDYRQLLLLKHWTWQFVVIRPVCSILMITLQLLGMYPSWLRWTFTIILNISVSLAMYSLVVFYHVFAKELKPHNPLAKFMCIKGIVFFCFWQVKQACIPFLSLPKPTFPQEKLQTIWEWENHQMKWSTKVKHKKPLLLFWL